MIGLGHREEALGEAKRALDAHPGSTELRVLAASALSGLGRREEALVVCDALVEASPDNAAFHLLRAITLSCLGRSPEALAAFQRAHRLDPASPMARLVGGIAMFDTGLCEDALNMLGGEAPDGAEGATQHLLRAHMLLAAGNPEDAVSACRRAIRLEPELVDSYCTMGRALLGLGRAPDALQAFDNSLSLDDGLATSHLGRAAALSAMGCGAEARRAFGRAAELDPRVVKVWESLEGEREAAAGAPAPCPAAPSEYEVPVTPEQGVRGAGKPGGQAPASPNTAAKGAMCTKGHALGKIPEGEEFDGSCPKCGADVVTECARCGMSIDAGTDRVNATPSCPRCGEPFPWSVEAGRAWRLRFQNVLCVAAAGSAILAMVFSAIMLFR